MKKRCTNSACRKEFRLMPGAAVCPYCGAQYRRIVTPAPRKQTGFAVVLTGWQGLRRLPIVRVMRLLTGCGLCDAADALKRPTVIVQGLPLEEAKGIALQLEQEGGTVALVPTGKAEKYGVPLFRG